MNQDPIKGTISVSDGMLRNAGYQLAKGATDYLCMVVSAALLVAIPMLLLALYLKPVDDCDRSWWDRCGMRVLTDAKTGKQYLATSEGGIIERAKEGL